MDVPVAPKSITPKSGAGREIEEGPPLPHLLLSVSPRTTIVDLAVPPVNTVSVNYPNL